MTDQKTIYRALRAVIPESDAFVVLHSSLFAFRIPGPALKWPLLGALRLLVNQGHTLALPCFSFRFCQGVAFDHLRTPSESGLLGDWFRDLSEVKRSRHPIYSFAVAGPRADEVLDCPSTTTYGPDSPFGLFDRENARLVMLGCGWQACTQFHHYEEQAKVPYRSYKTFVGEADFGGSLGEADFGGSSRRLEAKMYVRDLEVDPINDFSAATDRLNSDGRIARAELGEGGIESVSCGDLGRACRDLLKADRYAFVKNAAAVRYTDEAKRSRETKKPIKVAILGSANLELLVSALAGQLRALIPDREVEVYTPAFGQSARDVIDNDSRLAAFGPQFIFFTDRLEDLYQVDCLDHVGASETDALDRNFALIKACAERFKATIFVNRFTSLQASALGPAGDAAPDGSAAFLWQANEGLDRLLQSLPEAHGFDLGEAARLFKEGEIHDPRLWHLGRFPFSQAFSEALSRRYGGLILAACGRGVRLLALDLDDTLWGGILGEDGIEGLQLGGDYPGNAFAQFQKTLKRLSERGIALAVVSKNDGTEARDAMARLPAMVIREADLAAWRINWRDKPSNLLEIAEEVGLGLEHIAFIDDNPAERARMRLTLPAVKVIELPDDPARYGEALLASPYLECLTLTAEDRKRATRYASRRAMKQEQQRFTRIEDFYAYLQSKLFVAPLTPENTARAEQLAIKTNQFNTTLTRYSRAQLEASVQAGGSVYVLGLADRFTERENIGLFVIHWAQPEKAEIELFLLSCRVLGRGVESAALGWLAGEASRRGVGQLQGRIVIGPRNEPVRDLYKSHGFRKAKTDGLWVLDLSKPRLTVPDWIEVAEQVKESSHGA